MSSLHDPHDILDFWWRAGPGRWFRQKDAFDRQIRDRFADLHRACVAGEHSGWQCSAAPSLALIIVLDQFSRQIYRGSAEAFAHDELALSVARSAIDVGFDKAFPLPAKQFFYLPFTHAEDIETQETGVDLYRRADDEEGLFHALRHLEQIRRFGRFPGRNQARGLESTPEEREYLSIGY